MTELDLIPILCRRALEARLTPGHVRRLALRARKALEDRRNALEGLRRSWPRQGLTRQELEALRRALCEGRREVDCLERSLHHLQRWSSGGGAGDLERALGAYESAFRSWKKHLRAALVVAPALSGRGTPG